MLCALVMAGGKGERFWPLSTDEKPKQFLKLLGKKTMIQMTVERLLPLLEMDKIFIVTAKRYVSFIKEQLQGLPEENIIVEPVGRNTAPCIALSAFYIEKKYKDASIVVLPSDHLVVNPGTFRDVVKFGYEYVNKAPKNAVVTIGIRPDRPETGYGYIKYNSDSILWENGLREVALSLENKKDELNVYKVERFVEKPDKKKAAEYISRGNYLWNCGVFIWKCRSVIDLTKKYLENTYNILNDIFNSNTSSFENELEKRYQTVDNISVDYGIMEKAEDIYVVPADFGWDDIGTWYAVERYREKDKDNNVYIGDIKSVGSSNNIVYSKEKPIVVVGMEDVFVVESDDIIFVGKKRDIEKIKDIKKNVNGKN